jgi:hypothetical protein
MTPWLRRRFLYLFVGVGTEVASLLHAFLSVGKGANFYDSSMV